MKRHAMIWAAVCAVTLCARLYANAHEDEQRAAFFRVVDTWQKGPYGIGRVLSTQQPALLADVMYKTFTERGLTDVVVKALGEYCYPQGQEPWGLPMTRSGLHNKLSRQSLTLL